MTILQLLAAVLWVSLYGLAPISGDAVRSALHPSSNAPIEDGTLGSSGSTSDPRRLEASGPRGSGTLFDDYDKCKGIPSCDDGNPCTNDYCLPSEGCVHAPIACDDGNRCTSDTCDPVLGCVHSPLPAGTACGSVLDTSCDNPTDR